MKTFFSFGYSDAQEYFAEDPDISDYLAGIGQADQDDIVAVIEIDHGRQSATWAVGRKCDLSNMTPSDDDYHGAVSRLHEIGFEVDGI